MTEFIGTPYFVCPEILQRKVYTEKCDSWSLGVCLAKALTGNYPFHADDFESLAYEINFQPPNLENKN